MNKAYKILICEFHQESNTFNPIVMTLEQTVKQCFCEGSAFYAARKKTPCTVHGGIDAVEQTGGTVITGVAAYFPTGGRLEDAILELLFERTEFYIRQNEGFDAVYLALHGATCTVSSDDACGDYLEFVRNLVGEMPIVVSCDLHANITEKMMRNADAICGYQTYPHVDQYETGYRACSLCLELLNKEPVFTAAVRVPMLTPPSGYTSMSEPFKSVMDAGKALVQEGTLLDFSVFNVQPWLDIPELASRVLAVAKNPDEAARQAELLAQKLFDGKDGYWPELLSIDEVIDRAEANTSGKVVVLADAADSSNGGAVGDSPAVALRLAERGSKLRAAMFIKDPAAVEKAFALGVGASAEFSVGAGYTLDMPGPFKAQGTVCSLHDGNFRLEGPAERGERRFIGKAAVINFDTIDILVCEAPASTGDPQIFRHFGIEPTLYDLVVVKANTSFKVPYSAFAGEICYADTPGAGASNLNLFHWRHIPKGLYPFDLPEDFQLPKATVKHM